MLLIFIAILVGAVGAFRIALLARILIEWVRLIRPKMNPTGVVLALLTVPYMLTDWAVKPLRKLIKPIPMGASSFDLSVVILWVLAIIIESLLGLVH